MTSNEFDHGNIPSETQHNSPGILKEKEKKELARQIRDELSRLGSSFSKNDIAGYISLVETSKDLSELRTELEKTAETQEKKAAIDAILSLAEKIRSGSIESIRALENEILESTKKGDYIRGDVEKEFYFHKHEFVQKLEKSRLGKSVLKDGVGISIGVVESVIIVLQLLLNLVVDAGKIIASPKKSYQAYMSQYHSNTTTGDK